MAKNNYENVKQFCQRIVNLQKSHSKEIRLTREEAVSIMCELNQLLINESSKSTVNRVNSSRAQNYVRSISIDAGKF